jgi:hypothetical protein
MGGSIDKKMVRVERVVAYPNFPSKPDVKVSLHPAPRLFGTCHVYRFRIPLANRGYHPSGVVPSKRKKIPSVE